MVTSKTPKTKLFGLRFHYFILIEISELISKDFILPFS